MRSITFQSQFNFEEIIRNKKSAITGLGVSSPPPKKGSSSQPEADRVNNN